MKQKAYKYRLNVRGVFARNRKVKSAGFTLATTETDQPLPLQTAMDLAHQKAARIGLKPGGLAQVTEQPIEIEDNGDGFRSESYMIFTDKKLGQWVVE